MLFSLQSSDGAWPATQLTPDEHLSKREVLVADKSAPEVFQEPRESGPGIIYSTGASTCGAYNRTLDRTIKGYLFSRGTLVSPILANIRDGADRRCSRERCSIEGKSGSTHESPSECAPELTRVDTLALGILDE
jgi:hypothetical protein